MLIALSSIADVELNQARKSFNRLPNLQAMKVKTQMSNFDISAFVRESQDYLGMQVEKVFQMSYTEVWLRLSAKGKKATLVVKLGKAMWFEDEYLKSDLQPPNFAMLMRKYLGKKRLNSISQHGFDRIVVMEFGAENQFKLIIEGFGKGNMILVEGDKIIKPMTSKSWRHRDIKPGAIYKFPPEGINPLDLDLEDVSEILTGSDRDMVRALATQVNLGGSYAEEICEYLDLDKSMKASEVNESQIASIMEAMGSLIARLDTPFPVIKYDDGEVLDFLPLALQDLSDREYRSFDTFNIALKEYFNSLPDVVNDEDEDYVSPETQRLERQAEHQTEAIEKMEFDIVEYQRLGDLIYAEYARFEKILAATRAILDDKGWKASKAELEQWDKVISFDPDSGILEMKLEDDSHISLDVRNNVNDNAGFQYHKSKRSRKRLEGAREALGETLGLLKKTMKEDFKKTVARKKSPTRQMWFDRYRWFLSSEGFLVVGGRDARSNDKVVKKHLKDDGIYVHADIHGAPSIIVMKGRDAGEDTLTEACEFGVCQSKAWKAKLASGNAFWVKPDQVSKTAQPGEFLARGAFMIRGKRNIQTKLEMKLAIGEIMFEGERKIMCAPISSMKAHTSDFYEIIPGEMNSNIFAKKASDHYNVPIEEISRILPPGDLDIVRSPSVIKVDPEPEVDTGSEVDIDNEVDIDTE